MANETTSTAKWTSTQAYSLAVICLVIGLAVGYLLRGSNTPTVAAQPNTPAQMPQGGAPTGMGAMGGAQAMPSPEQMKHMADKQAEPLLASLKKTPNDPDLLYKVGNIYYDVQQYPEAVQYYEKALELKPNATDVRTDMATAFHFMGQPDKAISEYEQVLKVDPKHANALFNQGMVKWQDKMDVQGAIASWKQLLATNPDYPKRDQVQTLIAKAEQHMSMKPGTKTDKPAQIR